MAGCTVQKSTPGRSTDTLEGSGLSLWSKTGWGVGVGRAGRLRTRLLSISDPPLPYRLTLSPSILSFQPFIPFPNSPSSSSPPRFLPPLSPIPTFDSHLSFPVPSPLLPPLPPLTPSTGSPFPHSPSTPPAHLPYPSPAPRVSSPSAPPPPRPQPRPHELSGEPRRRHHPQRPPSRALQKGREGGDVS